MFLEIITPEKKLYSGEAEIVKLPGTSGSFEILMNHAPIISTLMNGNIMVKQSTGAVHSFDVMGGVVEVHNNHVIILVDSILKE